MCVVVFLINCFKYIVEELLDFCERYQQKWVFLSKMFYETTVCVQKAELVYFIRTLIR